MIHERARPPGECKLLSLQTAKRPNINKLTYKITENLTSVTVLLLEIGLELATGAGVLSLLTSLGSASGDSGTSGLLQSSRDDILGQSQELTQVLYALVGEVVVVPLPVENLLDVALGGERLHEHHNLKVGDVELISVLLGVLVLLDHQDSLCDNKIWRLDDLYKT